MPGTPFESIRGQLLTVGKSGAGVGGNCDAEVMGGEWFANAEPKKKNVSPHGHPFDIRCHMRCRYRSFMHEEACFEESVTVGAIGLIRRTWIPAILALGTRCIRSLITAIWVHGNQPLDEDNLAKRTKDCRPAYAAKSGIAALVVRLLNISSNILFHFLRHFVCLFYQIIGIVYDS
ncbi:hypothetical protein CPC08DRAFT_379142 [Agrocybe pediades]|nr:hypothetical protein CPC08DRAFT_379142 [Agrocybe pediades]